MLKPSNTRLPIVLFLRISVDDEFPPACGAAGSLRSCEEGHGRFLRLLKEQSAVDFLERSSAKTEFYLFITLGREVTQLPRW